MKLTKMNLLSLILMSSVVFISTMTAVAQSSATRRLYVATGGGFELNEAAANDALKAGADINWQNDAMGGETMLITSIKGFKEPNVIKYLLDHGADASIKDDSGKTALEWANQYNLGKNRNGRTILAMLQAATGVNGAASGTAGIGTGQTTRTAPPTDEPEPQQASPRGAPSTAEIKAMIEQKMSVNYENHFGGNELNKVTFEWLGPVQVIGTDVRGRIPHKCWNVKLDLKVTFEKPSSGEIGSVTRGIQGRPIKEMFCIWREDGGALDFVTYQP